jgi:transposase
MFAFAPSLRVFISTQPVSMSRSFDRLAEQVREVIGEDPESGHLFVFFNKSSTAAKLLFWQRGGYWLFYRRLERGRFRLPVRNDSCRSVEIEQHELLMMLEGLELDGLKHRARFFREAA